MQEFAAQESNQFGLPVERNEKQYGSLMDSLSPSQRSERMARVKNKNSRPEVAVRKMVHGMGFRYRLHDAKLPGKPDLVLAKHRKVIFVHGCFWHRHPDPNCKLARLPKSRLDFWLPKLEGNRYRDAVKQEALKVLGWSVLVVWECELRDVVALEGKIRQFLTRP